MRFACHRWWLGAVLSVVGAACAPSGDAPSHGGDLDQKYLKPSGPVELTPIKLSQLKEQIAGLKGKVVVVDFWADWCEPCKRAFPHLVRLHRLYGPKGLAAVSVNLDDPDNSATRGRVLGFLQANGADFLNLAPAPGEEADQWFESLQIASIPQMWVYGPDGELVRKFVGGDQYPAVERLVETLLASKN
ncbi:MAG: thioredoxin-like domain-containing protein [Gemmataceae bacterium]|nr:thioredoxin-like domain-containing protein [Gemmataceae bacterium]MDW8265581.1 thioredoxin-like domain-containing protein [Gemmataceae bacterium]